MKTTVHNVRSSHMLRNPSTHHYDYSMHILRKSPTNCSDFHQTAAPIAYVQETLEGFDEFPSTYQPWESTRVTTSSFTSSPIPNMSENFPP